MKAEGLYTDSMVAAGQSTVTDKSLIHAKDTYEKLYRIGDLIHNDYDRRAEDLPNLMTLMSS